MRVLKAILCVGLLAGCAARESVFAGDGAEPARTKVAGVPFFPQEGFKCGPSAMAMVLTWSGLDIKPTALERHFFTVKDPRRSLSDAANRYGRLAYPISGTKALMAELAAGHPVVIVQNLGVDRAPIWNCAVAVGYDRAKAQVLLHGGDQAGKRVSLRLFERLWADSDQWGLVVLKPGEMPAAARQPDYVKAAYSLEKAGRHWEAVLAYDAALSRWPSDSDTLMGLGSSLYSLGDPRGAADAYRAAARVAGDPTPAEAALAQIEGELQPIPASADQPLAAPLARRAKAASGLN